MHILMLAKEKGGAGASTLARELGVVAASQRQRVVFIDLDPQASLSNGGTDAPQARPNSPIRRSRRPRQTSSSPRWRGCVMPMQRTW